jgi:5-methyltetrahydrofolate--homocysteine methyltransferase
MPLRELADYIDWTPFFSTWELAGHFPEILDDAVVGEQARKLYADAQSMLKRLVQADATARAASHKPGAQQAQSAIENLPRSPFREPERRAGSGRKSKIIARAVYGLFPANSAGDDIEVYRDESRSEIVQTFHTLRQQMQKNDGANYALADFVAPKDSGAVDYIGAFAVSIHGAKEMADEYKRAGDDYNAILVEAISDRLAEAFAERLHKQARDDMGYGLSENLSNADLIHETYRGIRPAPGYPACPDHTEKRLIWDLLDVEQRAGITLTESCAMLPASSVSGWYFFHPQARYFGLGKISRDQVEDYARRKDMPVDEVEKWLATHLGY